MKDRPQWFKEPTIANTDVETQVVKKENAMSANTGLVRKIERARKLSREVLDLARRGKRDGDDLGCLILVLQALKDGHLFQARVTPRLSEERLAARKSRRSVVCIKDDNTRLVKVPVNHDDRMRAFPGVDWATEDKRESCIADRTGVLEEEIILRCFGRDMSSEDVIAALAKETTFGEHGLEPVSPEELRDLLKATQRDPNLPTPIAGLGVSWRDPDGYRRVPYLNDGRGGRCLDFTRWFEYDWSDGWWFAARRKSKS